ncbi:MAG: PilX N-terminal domain-containing pilus assembly protein [Pseudomonadota bacterium]
MTTRRSPYRPMPARQRGFTLIVALVMLLLVTMLAMTSFNLGKTNMQVVSNMQHRNEAIAAADQTLEELISNTQFFKTPDDALPSPCNGTPNTRCVDSNGDGKPDVTVTITPAPKCVKAQAIKNTALDLSKPEDVGCALGSAQSFGTAGSITGDSLCDDSVWEVHAVAADAVTEAQVQLTRGIAVRVAKDDVATSCP